jgi:hypothetical protein
VSENGGQTAGNREVIGELSVRSRSAYGLALWDGSQTSKRCVPLLNVMCTVHHVSDYFNLGSCWASCPLWRPGPLGWPILGLFSRLFLFVICSASFSLVQPLASVPLCLFRKKTVSNDQATSLLNPLFPVPPR